MSGTYPPFALFFFYDYTKHLNPTHCMTFPFYPLSGTDRSGIGSFRNLTLPIAKLMGMLFAGSLLLFPDATWAQWQVEHPKALQNGAYKAVSIPGTDFIYTYGYDQLRFDLADPQGFTIDPLPASVNPRKLTTTAASPSDYFDVCFTSPQHGVMADRETLWLTGDGGTSWQASLTLTQQVFGPVNANFTAVHFPTDSVGYAVGTFEKIFKTTDGGKSWQTLQWSSQTKPYRQLSDVYFKDTLHGYAVGFEVEDILLNIGAYTPILLTTEDGGQTWTEQRFSETDHQIMDIYPADSQTLYLSMVNRNYVIPSDRLFRSVDGGSTWQELFFPFPSTWSGWMSMDMHWFSEKEGLALGSGDFVGQNPQLFRTEDGGVKWNPVALPTKEIKGFTQSSHLAMAFNGTQGIIVGSDGNLIYSTDKGQSWATIREGYPDVKAISVDSQTAFAAGDGNLLLQKQAGLWVPFPAPTDTLGFRKIAHRDGTDVALVSTSHLAYRTTNQGATWQSYFPTQDTLAWDLLYIQDTLKVIARLGTGQVVLLTDKTGNGTWEANLIAPVASAGEHIQIRTQLGHELYVSMGIRVYHSPDGGQTWSQLTNLPAGASASSFTMNAQGNGLIILGITPYYTLDGGQSWEAGTLSADIQDMAHYNMNGFVQLSSGDWLAMVYATPSLTVRAKHALFRSQDQGKTWDIFPFPFDQEPIYPGINAWTVQADTVYLGIANGGIVSYVSSTPTSQDPHFEGAFTLYPNPVIRELTILPQSGHKPYQWRLMDAGGRILRQGQATRETQVDMSAYVPGLYFYSVTSNQNQASYKIIKR